MTAKKFIVPEVVEPDSALPVDLIALRRFAHLMDEAVAIPGTGRRVGIDAAVGLIPGVGDVIGGLLSAWIVIAAVRHRVPMLKVTRMMANILLDIAVGALPLLGDIFDFMFEENMMNMRLLMLHRDRRRAPRSAGEMFWFATIIVIVIVGFALLVLGAVIALAVWLASKR